MVFLILRCAGYGVIFPYNNMCEILENTMIDPIIITFFITRCLHTQMVQYGEDFYRSLEPGTSYSHGSLKLTESLFPGCASLYLLRCQLLGGMLY
jgi:hypothetical protein